MMVIHDSNECSRFVLLRLIKQETNQILRMVPVIIERQVSDFIVKSTRNCVESERPFKLEIFFSL